MSTIVTSQDLHFEGRQIILSDDVYENYIALEGVDYELQYLNLTSPGNKGGHSNVFLLLDPDIREVDEYTLVLKVCNYPIEEKRDSILRKRFLREIAALKKAKSAKSRGVIQIHSSGTIIIDTKSYHYYTMEYASNDLTNHLSENEIGTQQKIVLCKEILRGIEDLHKIGIYHRDIKHDNMLICGGQCKVGDLGLIRHRENDTLNEYGNRIGAFGWESPEVMNKYYAERKKKTSNYQESSNSLIDEKSDVFQLGKLFWYIFVGRIPVGQLDLSDFLLDDHDLFNLLRGMLLQSKENRLDLPTVKKQLEPIAQRYYAA
ncbi:protein kinase [Pontibacter silvestris]|uniref:Protein kinase n=1 Tax=Pontibacter silvestris TaxID=2305183 RepID=A0ABW4X327_9BACT|nr:protein kinase [Pontibacter silvestris]MCC9134983.1 protein kinase [Pontibacter silvestris]